MVVFQQLLRHPQIVKLRATACQQIAGWPDVRIFRIVLHHPDFGSAVRQYLGILRNQRRVGHVLCISRIP
jgi:hypothetical protein